MLLCLLLTFLQKYFLYMRFGELQHGHSIGKYTIKDDSAEYKSL